MLAGAAHHSQSRWGWRSITSEPTTFSKPSHNHIDKSVLLHSNYLDSLSSPFPSKKPSGHYRVFSLLSEFLFRYLYQGYSLSLRFSFEHSTSPVPRLCEDSSYPHHSLLYLLLPTFLWLRCGFSLPHLTRYCVHACRYCKFEFSVHVTCTFLAKYKIQQLCMWSGVTSNRWTTQGMVCHELL